MFDCPFCRSPVVWDNSVVLASLQQRVDAKDPQAIKFLGDLYYGGGYGLEKDLPRAIELWTEAAELGSAEAHFNLGVVHERGGEGVMKSRVKGIRHLEAAAMKGHAVSRFNLGLHEYTDGNYDRALRHFMISAKMGHKDSLELAAGVVAAGVGTDEQYDEALDEYQAAVEETKSPERDYAAKNSHSSNGNSDHMISLGPHQLGHSYFQRK